MSASVVSTPAQVAELVDALGSGPSGGNTVEVRVLSWAPDQKNPHRFPALRVFSFPRASAFPSGSLARSALIGPLALQFGAASAGCPGSPGSRPDEFRPCADLARPTTIFHCLRRACNRYHRCAAAPPLAPRTTVIAAPRHQRAVYQLQWRFRHSVEFVSASLAGRLPAACPPIARRPSLHRFPPRLTVRPYVTTMVSLIRFPPCPPAADSPLPFIS